MKHTFDGLITFDSTQQALHMEAKLECRDIEFDIRPIPQKISAGCGLAIEFYLRDLAVLDAVRQEEEIVIKGKYRKLGQDFIEI